MMDNSWALLEVQPEVVPELQPEVVPELQPEVVPENNTIKLVP